MAAPPSAAPTPHLRGLNPEQADAVEAADGPVLVLAGAGTGKTRVLTTRLAHLLVSRRARPWNILAVTFTNKAAREMKERIERFIGAAVEQVWLGTFHALAARVLRRHAELAGLKPNFTILDADDQARLLKQVLIAEKIDDRRWPARMISSAIQRLKDRGLEPERVTPAEAGDMAGGRLAEVYTIYQDRLKTLNAVDFGDLLLHNLSLFGRHGDVLARYQDQFRYLLVDEYQDTNVAQYLWLRLLAQKHRNICCVGDDDQSIYGWRGAEVGNILRFEKDFPGAKVVRLERNYRSTPHILAAASGLIAKNAGRLGKTLWTEVAAGEKVMVRGVWDGEDEARTVGEEIEALQRRGEPLASIAILVRAGFQTREFEERFLTLGLPYRVIGGPRFYERLEIRDANAYLRVVVQPDDDLAFERIVNTPRRGLGAASLKALHQVARGAGVSLVEAVRRLVETDELKPAARKTLATLVGDFDRWRALLDGMAHAEVVQTVLDESGYTAMWQIDKSPEAPGRLENLKELVAAIEEFETLPAFLEHVSLVMERAEDAGADQVTLMTLHAAKGLEFDTVFLPGWEEGLFPHQRALDENGNAGLEEERRLAYVGLTRARRRAEISYAASRRIHNLWQNAIPSRFIGELPAGHIDHRTAEGIGKTGGFEDFGTAWHGGRGAVGAQRGGRGRTLQGMARAVPDLGCRNAKPGDYREGTRVFHQKFGYGTVKSADGDKLEISFDKAGTKKVIDSFVTPA
ncbi:MAG: DNA helicase II [Alphaproteobacteria bacterium]|nr:DNA helicase II [Alphaproteobacteria bacterium]